MAEYKVFTIDEMDTTFAGLSSVVQELLRNRNKKFVPWFGSGIAKIDDGAYSPYNTGKANDVFVYSHSKDSEPFVGEQQAGKVVYPDFINNATKDWWVE